MPFRGFVKGGRDDFSFDAADHVGHFFRTLVDEKDDQDHFRIVDRDRIGDILENDRFTSAWRSDDQTALPFSDRRCQIEHAGRDILFGRLHDKTFCRIERGQVFKEDALFCFFRRLVVDLFHFEQGEVFFFFFWRADRSVDGIPFFQIESADLSRRNIDIFCRREVVVVGRAQKSKSIGKDFENSFADENFIGAGRFYLTISKTI